MELGLKRGTVTLEPHRPEWETAAKETIALLKGILGADAVDVQHVGSTAIRGIFAKPILDIAVGVRSLEDMRRHDEELAAAGVIFRGEDVPGCLLYVMGGEDWRSHHIHVVIWGGPEWNDYLNFRDYLNANPAAAERYSALKDKLAAEYPDDRGAYTGGKQQLIQEILALAAQWRSEQ